jgi:hypothetical protein
MPQEWSFRGFGNMNNRSGKLYIGCRVYVRLNEYLRKYMIIYDYL